MTPADPSDVVYPGGGTGSAHDTVDEGSKAPTVDLADFLLARIAEDKAVAQAAGRHWHGIHIESATSAQNEHVRRHAPARVLADCEARQRIVEQFSLTRTMTGSAFVTPLLRLLALPYADHPDHRAEWRV